MWITIYQPLIGGWANRIIEKNNTLLAVVCRISLY